MAKPRGKPFQKGTDERRGEGARKPSEMRELARAAGPMCIERLEAIVATSKNERHVVMAAQLLLERGYGRPTQLVGEDAENPFGGAQQTAEALRAKVLADLAARGTALPPDEAPPSLPSASVVPVPALVAATVAAIEGE